MGKAESEAWEAIATFFSLSETDITSIKSQEGIYSEEVLSTIAPTLKLSSCQSLLQERVSTLKSCFHYDVMAVQGSQYFSSHDFELALSEQLPPLDNPDNISSLASPKASDIFFMRLHQTNEQYLHFIDALEEYTLELDEDSVLAQRDLQRLETKLDLVMQLLADKKTLAEPANNNDLLFSYILTPQHFSLQLPLINSSISAECTHLLLTRLNTLLLDSSGECIKNTNSLQGFQRQIESNKASLEQVFVFSLNLHPLLMPFKFSSGCH